jgi:hypothetical protein
MPNVKAQNPNESQMTNAKGQSKRFTSTGLGI